MQYHLLNTMYMIRDYTTNINPGLIILSLFLMQTAMMITTIYIKNNIIRDNTISSDIMYKREKNMSNREKKLRSKIKNFNREKLLPNTELTTVISKLTAISDKLSTKVSHTISDGIVSLLDSESDVTDVSMKSLREAASVFSNSKCTNNKSIETAIQCINNLIKIKYMVYKEYEDEYIDSEYETEEEVEEEYSEDYEEDETKLEEYIDETEQEKYIDDEKEDVEYVKDEEYVEEDEEYVEEEDEEEIEHETEDEEYTEDIKERILKYDDYYEADLCDIIIVETTENRRSLFIESKRILSIERFLRQNSIKYEYVLSSAPGYRIKTV